MTDDYDDCRVLGQYACHGTVYVLCSVISLRVCWLKAIQWDAGMHYVSRDRHTIGATSQCLTLWILYGSDSPTPYSLLTPVISYNTAATIFFSARILKTALYISLRLKDSIS